MKVFEYFMRKEEVSVALQERSILNGKLQPMVLPAEWTRGGWIVGVESTYQVPKPADIAVAARWERHLRWQSCNLNR